MPDQQPVECYKKGAVATIWLNRPDALNALSDAMKAALGEAVRHADADPAIRIIVLRGRGRSFCSGADRRAFDAIESATRQDVLRSLDVGAKMIDAIIDARSIVVAAVHGHCVGGGVSLALASDLCLAADGTIFFVPEVDLSLPYLWGSTALMIATLGLKRTNFWTLTCDRFDAESALQAGLINAIHPLESLDDAILELVAKLESKPAAGLLAQKRLSNRLIKGLMKDLGDENQIGLDCIASVFPHLGQ